MLNGGNGDDMLKGQGGNRDQLTGGLGNDTIDGGRGRDSVVERGDVNFRLTDSSLNGLGVNVLLDIEEVNLTDGASANHFDASQFSGTTMLNGGAGRDTLLGGSGRDILRGGASRDFLNGDAGDDILLGQGGSGDHLTGGTGIDLLNGGAGIDRIVNDDVDSIIYDELDIELTI